MDMRYSPDPTGSAAPEDKAPQAASRREEIKGVFSTQSVVKFGTGATSRRTIQKTFWFVQEQDDDSIEVQPLNKNYIPSGPKRQVPKEEFLQKFSPEPEFYVSTVFPKMQELSGTISRGEKHRESGELYSAEFEFSHALKVDEENVRANFGLGLTYMDRGEKNKANDIFERLVKLDAAFGSEHKHLFNDFGINLRKSQMYDQAVQYYRRAIELTQEDDHLWINIARAYYEKGDMKSCADHLRRALEMNPGSDDARQFWNFLVRRGYISDSGEVKERARDKGADKGRGRAKAAPKADGPKAAMDKGGPAAESGADTAESGGKASGSMTLNLPKF
ncbi:Tetratricopeptide TPR_2 repeat-containing protein [Desulfovibrio sp. X2]|uniref:tetratricopeptide repeat protein n=1 Tax=Desulfovibrio sp. X2 TaxID=941449 RepID=UPI000358996B|nr:tetratricopeptide repeat protein [Desulfovibrio sp. X2]EPR41448.1 Tetratricopeptide TPR_2 repeat-containing protein [Desulfovibrio sp. X2]